MLCGAAAQMLRVRMEHEKKKNKQKKKKTATNARDESCRFGAGILIRCVPRFSKTNTEAVLFPKMGGSQERPKAQ